ncbi:MAG: hypothetical protein PUP46_01295, partial [Endozoicomonas sp. (ex Botrylloides leachii)]|nr:hypothetical protein [Endozoicomonas sp. (ex Botrylloides leachii)]
ILMINSSTGMTDTVWIVVRTSILGGSHAFLARLLKVTHQVISYYLKNCFNHFFLVYLNSIVYSVTYLNLHYPSYRIAIYLIVYGHGCLMLTFL